MSVFVFLPPINSLGKYSQWAIVLLFGDNLIRHLLESKCKKSLLFFTPVWEFKPSSAHWAPESIILLLLLLLLLLFSPGREEEAKSLNPNFLSGKAGAYLNHSCNLVEQK